MTCSFDGATVINFLIGLVCPDVLLFGNNLWKK